MAKLHELLAALGTAKGQSDKCRADLLNTFDKKRHLFGEKRVTFTPSAEGAQASTEEQSDIQSTIPAELKWIREFWARSLDVEYQIAESNMSARADVTLDDGTVLLKNVPATSLLELEKRAGEIHEFVSAIPTLDPAKGFRPDSDRPDGVFKAREVVKTRTQKQAVAFVKYEATKEHPAQVDVINKDVPIGTVREQEWSGLITPAQKADLIARAEDLRRALKTARSRANEATASTEKIGETILGFVFGN